MITREQMREDADAASMPHMPVNTMTEMNFYLNGVEDALRYAVGDAPIPEGLRYIIALAGGGR